MQHNEKPATVERSLLEEIEELDVLEAEELQEGVAFHAFRFSSPGNDISAIVIKVEGDAATLVNSLNLPHGATLMEVQADTMRILFDPTEVDGKLVQSAVRKSLGRNLLDLQQPKTRFKISQTRAKK